MHQTVRLHPSPAPTSSTPSSAAAFFQRSTPDRRPQRDRPRSRALVLAARLSTSSSSTICESRSTSDTRLRSLGSGSSSGVPRGLLELQPHPRERRAELMGSIGDELLLARAGAHRSVISLKLRASERCSLLPSTGALASRSPSPPDLPHSQPPNRPSDLPGDQRTGDQTRARARPRSRSRGRRWRAGPRC